MKEFAISSKEAGQRMDKYLFKVLNQASKGFVYKMLRKKNIVLNDKKATGQEVLKAEDQIKIYLSDETFAKFASALVETQQHLKQAKLLQKQQQYAIRKFRSSMKMMIF